MSPFGPFYKIFNHPNTGLLILRLWLGVVGVYHGSQKLFGAFGGPGLKGFAGWLETMHVPAPGPSAVLAGLAEFAGGLLVAAGLLTRPAALVFAINMLVAIALVHTGAFSNANNGLEFPMTLAVALLAVTLVGPGQLSADAAIARARPRHGLSS